MCVPAYLLLGCFTDERGVLVRSELYLPGNDTSRHLMEMLSSFVSS